MYYLIFYDKELLITESWKSHLIMSVYIDCSYCTMVRTCRMLLLHSFLLRRLSTVSSLKPRIQLFLPEISPSKFSFLKLMDSIYCGICYFLQIILVNNCIYNAMFCFISASCGLPTVFIIGITYLIVSSSL